jgi:hypothetical protein
MKCWNAWYDPGSVMRAMPEAHLDGVEPDHQAVQLPHGGSIAHRHAA